MEQLPCQRELERMETASKVAPRWHTALLVGLMVAVALTGLLLSGSGVSSASSAAASLTSWQRITSVYLPMLIVQFGLVFYVARAFRCRNELSSLIGERWSAPRRAAIDVFLACVAFVAIMCIELGWRRIFGSTNRASVAAMLPVMTQDRLAWVIVAMSVGFCEEVVYRGYLQTQLRAFTGSIVFAVAFQALLFGLAHGQQGTGAIVRCCLHGLVLGGLAAWRRSLIPSMICHVAIDLVPAL